MLALEKYGLIPHSALTVVAVPIGSAMQILLLSFALADRVQQERRLREQARCAAIFASPAAAKNPVMAAKLAFQTRMPRSEAVALLEGTPAPTAVVPANPSRAARNPNVGANGGAQVSPQQAAAARWDAHLKAATPAARRRA